MTNWRTTTAFTAAFTAAAAAAAAAATTNTPGPNAATALD